MDRLNTPESEWKRVRSIQHELLAARMKAKWRARNADEIRSDGTCDYCGAVPEAYAYIV